MKWYNKYLQVYGKPFTDEFYPICEHIRERIDHLHSTRPIVTVSIIAYNEEKHLLACLWTLSDMVCKYPIEIIGVDNDSKDRTAEIYKRCGVQYYTEKRHSPGYARNCGLEHSKGKYHICIDSDSLYPKDYVEFYTKTLMRPDAVCCYGLWSFIPDSYHTQTQLKTYEFLRDCYLKLQNIKRPELNVRGMTFAFKTDIGKKLKFRTDIIRGEDGSLALAMKRYGKLVFITNKKTRIVTDNNTMNADGTMAESFIRRIKKVIHNGFAIMKDKKDYQDDDSNLIK